MVWELKFIELLQARGNGFWDFFWNFFTLFGEEMLLVGIIGLVYWCFDKKIGENLTYCVLTSAALNGVIKNAVVRLRPLDSYPESSVINKKPKSATGYSFPSGHSQASATLFTSLAANKPKKLLIAAAVVIPLLVVFSRVYLGVHFPTDALAGFFVGVAVALICHRLHNKIENKLLLYGMTVGIMLAGGLFIFLNADADYEHAKDYFTALGMLLGCLGGFLFEHKFVNFEYNKVWWKLLLRLAGGAVIVAGFRYGLGELFGLITKEHNILARLLDTLRYALMSFAAIGLYPLLFKKLNF